MMFLNKEKKFEFTGRIYNIKKIKRGVCFLLEEENNFEVIKCIFFAENDLKEKERVEISGFPKEEVFYVKKLSVIEDDFLKEYGNNDYKFNELFICTKMSLFGSIIDLEYLFSVLKKRGYKYIGITDINNVCSWTEVEKLSEKYEIKVVYGVQLDVFDDETNIFKYVKNIKKKIKEINFVVLDLESNGLNFKDIITEIGWVELKNGDLGKTFSSLIYSDQELNPLVKQITGINEKMIRERGININIVLKKLYEVLNKENTILVTHNKFDINILRYHYKNELNINFTPSYIDSKELFGIAFPEKRKKSLENLCKDFNLDITNSHRAKEDAVNTALLLQIAFDRLNKNNDKSIEDLPNKLHFSYQSSFKLFAFAKNFEGKSDIFKLMSTAFTKHFFKFARTPLSEIKKKRSNLILVSNCLREGELFNKYFFDFENMQNVYDFYDYIQLVPFEILMNNMYEKNKFGSEGYFIEPKAIQHFYDSLLTQKSKLIGSSFPNFLFPQEYVLTNILKSLIFSNKYKDSKRYFRTYRQMYDAFSNINEIDKKIILKENIESLLQQINYKKEKNTSNMKLNLYNSDHLLWNLIEKKVIEKYGKLHKEIYERINYEYEIIKSHNFSDIYYLVSLLLEHLKNKYEIIFGSRGSIGSSFIAFILDITEVNPIQPHEYCKKCFLFRYKPELKCGFDNKNIICDRCGAELLFNGHGILFETFSGFEGNKAPDIDINVPTFYHDTIHEETIDFFSKYEMQVFSCGMNSKLQNKNAFFYIKRYVNETELNFSDNQIDLFTYKSTGIRLSSSKHPGGLVILPKGKEIYDFTPLQCTDRSNKENLVTHFDHISLENKIFKLDLLAHDDPTTLGWLLKNTKVNLEDIKMNLPEVINIFSTEDKLTTIGIPEFGTPFIRRILSICKPKTFAELIRISGIAHGINVWTNNAEKLITEENLSIEDVICVRDDIFDFLFKLTKNKNLSFEIMEFIRKGKLKNNKEKFNYFVKEMRKFDVPEWYIESLSKITYLFPRAHAVAYVTMAYTMAYFKIYHPLEFYNAYLNRKIEFIEESMILASKEEMNNFIYLNKDKAFDNKEKNVVQLYEVILEIRERGIKIENIDINKSLGSYFNFNKEENSILPPINIVKGIGSLVANNIEKENKKKPFQNISDFKRRSKVNTTQVKILQKIGAVKLKDIKTNSLENLLGN